MYEQFTALKVERKGVAVWVTLDNPPLNGMTPDMHTEISHIFRTISRDPEARVVVLTGAGDRGFSAGGDINRMAEGIDDHGRWCASMPEAREIVLNILECDKPVIGRINGHAIGLGASMALACDITIMSERAKIGDTHVKVGLVAGDGGSLIWPHLVGWMQAKRWLLTGDLLTGAEAEKIGLVTYCVAPDQLDAKVAEWIDKLGNGPTVAIGLTKRSLNMAIRQQGQTFMDAQLGLETMSHLSEDHREAVFAFRDKRDPKFTGR